MTAKTTQRPYKSPLREEQAERTRERILDAFAEQIVDSSRHDFSISLVAKRAGVSLRTVYHHFPNREAILVALHSWVEASVQLPPMPATADGLPEYIETCFKAMDAAEPLVRVIQSSWLAGEAREWGRQIRRQNIERLVRSVSERLTEEQVSRGVVLVHYFLTTNAWRFFKDEAGMDAAHTVSTVTWAVQSILNDLKQEAEAPRKATAVSGGES